MTTNLVSAIMQSFSPEAVGRLASTLGLEQPAVQKGVSAGIPGILAGLANTASGHDGAQRLGRALSHVDDLAGRGGDIAKNLLDSGKSLFGSGWNIGSSLLGGSALETLSSMVARYAGIDLGSGRKLLGFLVPGVLAFLKREQSASGLDNKGLANLLVGQKANIERAMPAGLASLMHDVEAPASVRPTAPAASL